MDDICDNLVRLYETIKRRYHRHRVERSNVELGNVEPRKEEEVAVNPVLSGSDASSIGAPSEQAEEVDVFGLRVTMERIRPGVILASEALFREVRVVEVVEPREFCHLTLILGPIFSSAP